MASRVTLGLVVTTSYNLSLTHPPPRCCKSTLPMLFLSVLVLGALRVADGLQNALARTPPMGWSSWNAYGCDVDESKIRATADVLASRFGAAGYLFVNTDDCWQSDARDADGRLQANATTFSSGIQALAEYVHEREPPLLFGIYSSAGTKTCVGLPGSLGHEAVDAATFAEWRVDFLKYDNCGNQRLSAVQRYGTMAAALSSSGRAITYSVCDWGVESPERWAPAIANSWRTSIDIRPSWTSVLANVEVTAPVARFSQPGAWADADALEIGNGALTPAEERSHFALWVLLKSPLILRCVTRLPVCVSRHLVDC